MTSPRSSSPRSPRGSSPNQSPRGDSPRDSPRGDSPRGRRNSARQRRNSTHEDSPRWENPPRKRPAAGRSNSSLLADVVVKNDEIEDLKESLHRGGGVIARKSVGEFLKGFRIAAGQDLKLEAFDITGLKDGDEVDPRLASVVQDSLAGSREDDRDIRLYARPPWYVPEETVRIGRCRAFWSRILPCCVRKPKRWHRKLHFGEGLFACYVRVQQVLLRLVYRSSSAMKQRDAFVSFQDSDKDLARWLRLFCDMRSLSVYAQLPNDAARKTLKADTEEKDPARASLRASVAQNFRGTLRKSLRSMGSAASQQEEQIQEEAEEPAETAPETAVPVDEDSDVSLAKWLDEREHLIRTSRVLLVIASQDSLENAGVLQDCLWAWQWGVPVLPVRRVGDEKIPKELRKKLRFLYSLKMGLPEVGLGTNRKDFFFKISSALAAGIRMGRSYKKKGLPRNAWEYFFRAVKHLQRDAKDLVAADQQNLKEKPLCLTSHEARFRIEGGFLVDIPDLGKLQSNEAETTKAKTHGSKRQHKNQTQKEPEPEPVKSPEATNLSSAMEDRTYGILEMLSLQGQQNVQVATKAVNALRSVTAVERGSRAVAMFGGVDVLLKLATFACNAAQEKKQASSGRRNLFGRSKDAKDQPASPTASASPRSPKGGRNKESASARDKAAESPKSGRMRWAEESPRGSGPKSARGRGHSQDAESARDFSPKSARWRGDASARDSHESPRGSPRGSPQGSPGSPRIRGSPDAEEFAASPRHAPKSARGEAGSPDATAQGHQEQTAEPGEVKSKKPSKRRCCLPCCRRKREEFADDDDEHSDDEDQGGQHGAHKSGDSTALFLRLADHSLASLRNLAAHSVQRKQQILEKRGEEVAIEALQLFRGRQGAELCSRSCTALLRNLSEGVDGVLALAESGFLQIAEDELEDGRGAPGVRMHILAALQNMAACVDESPHIFPYPEHWLELCALAAQTAVEDRDARTTRQALGAMGNFAILRAAKEAMREDDRSDHGLPFAPLGHMTTAAAVADPEDSDEDSESGSEGEKLQDLANQSTLRSKSVGSDIPSIPTNDQEMEHSLNKAYGKVSPDIVQRMLDLIQVNATRTSTDVAARATASTSIATSAAATLANFAQDTDIERLIGSMGGIETVLEAVSSVNAEDFQLQAVRFLWNMTFSKVNQQRFMDNDGVGKVLAAMQKYQKPHHSPLQEQGCGVLRNLAYGNSGRHKLMLLKSGVIKAVCEALRKFYQEVNVCMQAVSALTALCTGAPPAAMEAKKNGAARWLVSALKLTGDNAEITELILQAMEAILLIPQALTPFGRRCGHLEVLKVLDRFTTDTTMLMAFRTLAAALSHTKLKDILETDKAEGDKDVKSHSEEFWKQMGKAPGTSIRSDLMEHGLLQKVIDALQKFEEYTIAIEAGAGVLMNVALEVQEPEEDARHLQRKLDVGLACHKCLTIIGHLATSRQNTGFVSNMFRLLAAVCLHEDIALLLHRKQAATKTLEYLKAFRSEPSVQASGCAFLSNLANSKLRIREAIVGVGSLEYLIGELKASSHDAVVVQSMCKALKDLSPAEAAIDTLKRYNIIDLVFEAADRHLSEATVMEASLALLWTLSAIHRYAEELNTKDATNRALEVLRRHSGYHDVCRCCGGLLRNLFAAPLSAKAADECLAAGGLRLLLDALWQHCLPPVQGTMSQAAYAWAKRGSMESMDPEGEAGPPKRAGSTLEGNGINRAGSILGRRGSNLPQDANGAGPSGRRTSVGRTSGLGLRRNSIRRQSDPDLAVKVFNLDAADAVSTVEKMAVAEQILAALRNLVAFSKLSSALAEEIYKNEEWDNLRMVVELYPKSIMVQYQGFELVGKLVTAKRELRAAFRQIADHVLLTNLNHKNTPVADVAELLLEALN